STAWSSSAGRGWRSAPDGRYGTVNQKLQAVLPCGETPGGCRRAADPTARMAHGGFRNRTQRCPVRRSGDRETAQGTNVRRLLRDRDLPRGTMVALPEPVESQRPLRLSATPEQ